MYSKPCDEKNRQFQPGVWARLQKGALTQVFYTGYSGYSLFMQPEGCLEGARNLFLEALNQRPEQAQDEIGRAHV